MAYLRTRYGIIPHALIDSGASAHALAVYAVLTKHADFETGKCWPGVRTIAGTRMAVDTARKAIAELVNLGFLRIEKPKRGMVQKYDLSVLPDSTPSVRRDSTVDDGAVLEKGESVLPDATEVYYPAAPNEPQLTNPLNEVETAPIGIVIRPETQNTITCQYCNALVTEEDVVIGFKGTYCGLKHKGLKEGLTNSERRELKCSVDSPKSKKERWDPVAETKKQLAPDYQVPPRRVGRQQ